jgi:hypothetical protein
MKKKEAAFLEAEAFVRKAVSRFGQRVADEKSIKTAAQKLSQTLPPRLTRSKAKEIEVG